MVSGKITYNNTGDDCYFEGTFNNGSWNVGTYKKGPAYYTGTFVDQAMEGQYKVQWENGIVYEGAIVDNKLHGDGIMTFTEGNISSIEGTWQVDTLTTCRLLTMRDGSTATNYDPVAGKLRG